MSRRVLIVREALISAPLVTLIVALPVALVDPGPFSQRWVMGAALLVVPLVFFIAAARMARRSLGELLPGSRRTLFVGVATWAALSFPVHAVLGLVLKATTHHRGLAGATFGALALSANAATALLSWRFSVTAARWGALAAGALNACLGAALAVEAALATRTVLAPSGARVEGVEMGAVLVGSLVAVVATLLAARWDAPRRQPTPPSGPGSREPI